MQRNAYAMGVGDGWMPFQRSNDSSTRVGWGASFVVAALAQR